MNHKCRGEVDRRLPERVRVLIGKIERWLLEHPEALNAADKGRLVIHIQGETIRVHVEQIYERI